MRLMFKILLALGIVPTLIFLTAPAIASNSLTLQITSSGGEVITMSIDELEAMGLDTVETTTTWTDGKQVFDGILLSRLADRFGKGADKIIVKAINDYEAEIEIGEVRKYPVLLALRQNGERMPVRDKGPGWVVYPRDDFPELADERHNFKWVWQVVSITYK